MFAVFASYCCSAEKRVNAADASSGAFNEHPFLQGIAGAATRDLFSLLFSLEYREPVQQFDFSLKVVFVSLGVLRSGVCSSNRCVPRRRCPSSTRAGVRQERGRKRGKKRLEDARAPEAHPIRADGTMMEYRSQDRAYPEEWLSIAVRTRLTSFPAM